MISETAKKYHELGLSVIPMGSDKLPKKSDTDQYQYPWKKHQTELISPGENFQSAWGMAVVAGKVSGNLECLDIDLKYDLSGTLYAELKQLIADNAPDLLKKMVVQKTQGGGYHFLYRLDTAAAENGGNQKIAMRPTTEDERIHTYKKVIEKGKTVVEAEKARDNDKVRVLIETRGEGGYFGVYPTTGYELVFGSMDKLQVITAEEREVIFGCSRQFNQVVETAARIDKKIEKVYTQNKSPFEDYNEQADIREILESNGWTMSRSHGSKFFYGRPGTEYANGWGAEYDDKLRLFYVFTSSSLFDSNRAYNAAQVLTILKFGGDYSACAKQLVAEGYGERAAEIRTKAVNRELASSKISIADDDNDFSFIADDGEVEAYLKAWREGTFQMGQTTGWKSLDKYFLFKRGYFDIFNGIDNVGKSTTLWYLILLSALYHDWRWIIISMENRNGAVTKKLIEFYWGIPIKELTDEQYAEAKKFIKDHFTIIKNEEVFNFQDVMNIADKCNRNKKHDGMLIDPYNALSIALAESSKLSTHEYHYEGATRLQQFTKKRDMCIYLNCHVNTEAARSPEKAPGKAHTEGGAKFANKADDFGTIHRHTNDPERWTKTEFHTRKIKEMETGGGYTPYDQPFIMEMLPGGCCFIDENRIDPVREWHNLRGIKNLPPTPIQANIAFLEIKSLVPEKEPVVYNYQNGDDHPF